jgi:hypothetical protein
VEPVDSAAGAWAEARAGTAFTETRTLERFGYSHNRYRDGGNTEARVAVGPQVDVPLPEVWALSDTVLAGTRHLRLGVRSRIGAELLQFLFPEGGGTRLTSINGTAIPQEAQPALVEHWGTPDPVVFLELELAEGTQPDMDIVEHLLRPQELLGDEPFQRSPELAPDIVWKSDRAMIRTPAASMEIVPGPPPFSLEPESARQSLSLDPGALPPAADSLPSADTAVADTVPAPTPVIAPDTTVPPDTSATSGVGEGR